MKCGAFDSGLCIHPDGKVTPCCQFDITLSKNINDLDWNNPWQDLRDGKGCDACRHSGTVYRDAFENHFNDNFAVRFLDIRNNNLCNMECVICNSYYSSKWAERLGHEQKFIKSTVDVDLSQVSRIYFAGGEPFLNKTHWEILDAIPNPEKVGLVYSSNLTTIKGVEKHWPKFRNVFLNASLDGIGTFGEQVRPGLDWQRWQENLKKVLSYNNVNVEIACTVSIANVWHLEEMKQFADDNNVSIRFYRLINPDYLTISAIPTDLKKQIKYIPNQEIQELLDQNLEHLFNHAVANILLGDKLRGTNLWDYLPYKKWAIKNLLDY